MDPDAVEQMKASKAWLPVMELIAAWFAANRLPAPVFDASPEALYVAVCEELESTTEIESTLLGDWPSLVSLLSQNMLYHEYISWRVLCIQRITPPF